MTTLMGDGRGLEDHRSRPSKPVNSGFCAIFDSKRADRGRFVTSSPFISCPFFTAQAARFPNLRTHLSEGRSAAVDFLEVVRHADQGELPRHFRRPAPESPKSRVLDLPEHRLHDRLAARRSAWLSGCDIRSFIARRSPSRRSWTVRAAPDFDRQQTIVGTGSVRCPPDHPLSRARVVFNLSSSAEVKAGSSERKCLHQVTLARVQVPLPPLSPPVRRQVGFRLLPIRGPEMILQVLPR